MIEKIILFLICLSIYFFPDRDLDPIFLTLFTLIGIILIKKIFSQKLRFSFKINWLNIALLSLPISMFISTLFSSYKYPSLLSLGELILLYLAFFTVSILEEDEKNFTLKIIMIVSFFHSLFSILKYFFLHQYRASGNFLNPNHSAFALFVGLILILSFSMEKKKIYILFAFPIIMAIILSRSRSTLLAIFIFLPFIFYDKKRMSKIAIYLISFTILIVIILLLVPNPLSRYLMRTYDPFSFRRIHIWNVGIKMFLDNWIKGVGPSNFYYRLEPYKFPEEGRIARYAITIGDAHNDYIQLFAELGILSIPFTFGIFLLSRNLLKNSINSRDWRIKGTSIALLSIFFNSFFTNSIFHIPISFLVIFLLSTFPSLLSGKEFLSIKFEIENLFKILLTLTFSFILIVDGVFPLISNRLLRNGAMVAKIESMEKGLKMLNVANRLTPLNSSAKKEIGIINKIIYLRTDEPFYLWSSVSAFNESLRLNPYDSDSHKELAEIFTILLRRKRVEEGFKMAEFHWKKALAIAPFNPFYYYNLSQLYIITYNDMEAERALKKCIELEPNFIMAHYSLYKIYEERGEVEKRDRKRDEVIKLIKMFGNKNYPSFYFNMLFSVPQRVLEEMMGSER